MVCYSIYGLLWLTTGLQYYNIYGPTVSMVSMVCYRIFGLLPLYGIFQGLLMVSLRVHDSYHAVYDEGVRGAGDSCRPREEMNAVKITSEKFDHDGV